MSEEGRKTFARAREITLPKWHDDRLAERMAARDLTRSEAIRELIVECHTAGTGRRDRLRQFLREIRIEAKSIRLSAKGAHRVELDTIDAALAAAEQLLLT